LLRFVWLYVVVAGDCSKAKHAKPIEPLHANFHTETQMPRFKMRNLRAENLWHMVHVSQSARRSRVLAKAVEELDKEIHHETSFESVWSRKYAWYCLILLMPSQIIHDVSAPTGLRIVDWVARSLVLKRMPHRPGPNTSMSPILKK
jgi:hypothetical protein